MNNDAQWLAEKVILPRLDALDKKLEVRDKATKDREEKMWSAIEDGKKCATKTKLKLERQNGKLHIHNAEIEQLKVCATDIENHLVNDMIHFNKDKAKETSLAYITKKKMLAILITTLSAIATAITAYITIKLNTGV